MKKAISFLKFAPISFLYAWMTASLFDISNVLLLFRLWMAIFLIWGLGRLGIEAALKSIDNTIDKKLSPILQKVYSETIEENIRTSKNELESLGFI